MDTIKLLNSLEVGIPLIVTTTYQGITRRKVTLYGGTRGDGVYHFMDDSGIYGCSIGYIKDHVTVSQELDQENDIYELARLTDEVKEKGMR